MGNFIGLAALQQIATAYSHEIVMGGAYYRPDLFERLKIKIVSGVQFKHIKYVMNRKGHTTVRKVVGEKVNSQVGYLEERELVAYLSWNHYTDNKDNYIETPVVDVDDSASFSYPLSELAFKAATAQYGEDVFDCLWNGDASISGEADNKYLRLYDGFLTYLNHDIESGRISKALGNLVTVDAISAPTDAEDISAWNTFKAFRTKWHQNLKNAPEVLVYMNEETAEAVADAYSNAKGNHKEVIRLENGNYKFPEFRNVEVASDDSMGTGCKMLATVPFNFEYGVNTEDSRTKVTVREGSDNDHNDITYQVQSVQGTRVVNVNPTSFCMTDAAMTPVSMAGDYYKAVFALSVSPAAGGTVTVNGQAPDNEKDYASGTTLALKAEATEGYSFSAWSDGVKTAERSVVTSGQPAGLTAIFTKD